MLFQEKSSERKLCNVNDTALKRSILNHPKAKTFSKDEMDHIYKGLGKELGMINLARNIGLPSPPPPPPPDFPENMIED